MQNMQSRFDMQNMQKYAPPTLLMYDSDNPMIKTGPGPAGQLSHRLTTNHHVHYHDSSWQVQGYRLTWKTMEVTTCSLSPALNSEWSRVRIPGPSLARLTVELEDLKPSKSVAAGRESGTVVTGCSSILSSYS